MEYIPMASMNSGVVFCVEFQWEASVELWVLCPLLLMMLMLQGRANEEMDELLNILVVPPTTTEEKGDHEEK